MRNGRPWELPPLVVTASFGLTEGAQMLEMGLVQKLFAFHSPSYKVSKNRSNIRHFKYLKDGSKFIQKLFWEKHEKVFLISCYNWGLYHITAGVTSKPFLGTLFRKLRGNLGHIQYLVPPSRCLSCGRTWCPGKPLSIHGDSKEKLLSGFLSCRPPESHMPKMQVLLVTGMGGFSLDDQEENSSWGR